MDHLKIIINHIHIKLILSDRFPSNTYCLKRKGKKSPNTLPTKQNWEVFLSPFISTPRLDVILVSSHEEREDIVSSLIPASF